jgi:hypothetical protein
VRLTAVFRGTQGPGGVVCPETGRLYSDPIGQMKREGRAKRVLLYTYERPKGG